MTFSPLEGEGGLPGAAPAPPPLRILNPTPFHELNYDYGYQRKRPVTHLTTKARAGAPYFRDVTDVMHSLVLNWADRSLKVTRELKQFYEQYRGGAFVLIDHEGGGRQYVGRFTTPVEPVPTRNITWTVQSVQFDELPGILAPRPPQDWQDDAIWMQPLDYEGNSMVTISGTWATAANPLAEFGVEVVNANTDLLSWAQMQYIGYGFQLWGRTGPDMGIAGVWLDGVQIGTLDFYAAAAGKSAVLVNYPAVALGIHRVKLTSTNTTNAASTGNTIAWDSLRVMR